MESFGDSPETTTRCSDGVTVAFIGDYGSFNGQTNVPNVLEALEEQLAGVDVLVFNCEAPIWDSEPVPPQALRLAMTNLARAAVGIRPQPLLRGSRAMLNQLNQFPFVVGSLATNHLLDMGHQGILETLVAFRELNIAAVGAGPNVAEANHVLSIEVQGQSLAFLNINLVGVSRVVGRKRIFMDVTRAKRHRPGSSNYRWLEFLAQVARAKESHDWVFPLVHIGAVGKAQLDDGSAQTIDQLLDHGADMVVFHHSHVSVMVPDRPNVFGLGDFHMRLPPMEPRTTSGLVVTAQLSVDGQLKSNVVEWDPVRMRVSGSITEAHHPG